ncbi:MAG: monovalent cation/H+ antiporter subunit D family protein [Candidatus Omnitrophica bacterium]|nr:monovalent cation/H+ antiporter subunit D family protein [Candidatus Omnitrophota bacterium]
MIKASDIIPFFVIIPLAGAFLLSLFGRRARWVPDFAAMVAAILLCYLSLLSARLYNTYGLLKYSVGAWMPPVGIGMVLDGLTAFLLVTVNLVTLCVTVFSINYMEKYTSKWKFYTLFLLMVAGMNGVIITGDLFNMFVFLEIASVASYALVAFGTEKHELEAAFKYAIMGTVGSLFILLAIAFLYTYTSTLNMADMANILAEKGSSQIVLMASVLFIMGLGLKAALVPFHAWLPDAHPSAPAPISAMLSGVLIKSLGVYTLCRIFFNVIGLTESISSILMLLGVISMVIGVFLAIGQWDFKRLLAYHSISQIGYVMLGIGLGTPLGILGGLFHLFNHSIFKSLLFLNSGAVEYSTGTRDLKEMGGLSEKMPITSGTSLVASMSIAGVPPFNGFWSKLLIIFALVEAGRYGYAFWAVIASILTLSSFMKVMKYAFFGELNRKWDKVKEVPFLMKLSMVMLAFICIAGGLLIYGGIGDMFLKPAAEAMLTGTKYGWLILNWLR